jgi:hypothetical protein
MFVRKRPLYGAFTDEEYARRMEAKAKANELTPSVKGALSNRRKPVTLPTIWKDK